MKTELHRLLDEKNYSYFINENGTTVINHDGDVYLDSLTSITTDIKFENSGSVYLPSLTSITTDIKFENSDYVDLYSLTSINYQNKTLNLKQVDGYTMIIESKKSKKDFTIYKTKYFKGGNLSKLPTVFIAEKEKYTAHGSTIKKAIEDCNFKFLQATLNTSELIQKVKEKGKISVQDYRLLTGACQQGCEEFIKSNSIKDKDLTIENVIKITKDSYGGQKIKELFNY